MRTAPARHPPGPRSLPLLGSALEYGKDPIGFTEHCARGGYGDVVYFTYLRQRTYVLNHPDHIEYVLVTRHRHYVKDAMQRRILGGLLGNGLLPNEGESWLRQRRLMQPAFHRQRLAGYGQVMAGYAQRLAGTWREGEVRDVYEDMMQLTLRIVARCLFSLELEQGAEVVGPAMEQVMEHFTKLTSVILPEWLPTPDNLAYRGAVGQLRELVDSIIHRRRESGGDTGDLLSTLLQVQDEDGSRMSDTQIRDEVLTLVLAGHETTAITLAFCCHLLAHHPEVEARLHQELDTVLGGREPTLEDMPALTFTEHVVKEALRLYPPAWSLSRTNLEDDTIGGWPIPAGSLVVMNPYAIHRDPRFYEEPQAFRPQRWADGLEQRIPRFAWFPFGGGPRLCIGLSFALMEARLVLATLAQHFRFEPVSPLKPELQPSITLRPKHGLQVKLRARTGGAA
jgi:cytochrome P450